MGAPRYWVTSIVRARFAVATILGRGTACTFRTGPQHGARIAVVTWSGIERVDATRLGIAAIIRAHVSIITGVRGAHALPVFADIFHGTGIPVVAGLTGNIFAAGRLIKYVSAEALVRVACIDRTAVVVIAVEHRPCANPVEAGVVSAAGIPVITKPCVVLERALTGIVIAGPRCAGVTIIAQIFGSVAVPLIAGVLRRARVSVVTGLGV